MSTVKYLRHGLETSRMMILKLIDDMRVLVNCRNAHHDALRTGSGLSENAWSQARQCLITKCKVVLYCCRCIGTNRNTFEVGHSFVEDAYRY